MSFDMEKLKLRRMTSRPSASYQQAQRHHHRHGLTGCGKTINLYSAPNELDTIDVKIITTEDPVEYDIDGLIQCQMKPDIGLTFARCLRSILRQDPDIILVGEIRDLETAEIAAQASLTGHLVFTTLHTNDAPSSIARLLDLGVEPFLITATLEDSCPAQRKIWCELQDGV
jgi:type IV pilus assembly protein PilB